MKYLMLLCVVGLSACGGGGSDPSQSTIQAVAPVPTVVLRPCETTGPTAPPCPTPKAVAR